MATITRWDPFREMFLMRRNMDRLFDSMIGEQGDWTPTAWNLALDLVEDNDEYVVKASLPGINPDDIEITFNDKVLTIKGEIKKEQVSENTQYHLRERRYGSFSRSISLPRGVNADAIEASYNHGVLTLRLPKMEEVKPKRISVRSTGAERMIEGKVTGIAGKN